jgi:kynurenine formamidase
VAKRIRGVMFEENLKNSMGLEFYNLSHRFGYQSPNWPYFEDVKIERIHYMAKSGVLSQRITTSMHNTTHIDAPAHVVQGTPFIDEVPLPHFFGSGIVVSLPKNKWEPITGDDLEKACGKIVRPRDVVIINTGWHKFYEDSEDYFPGARFRAVRGGMVCGEKGQGDRPRYPGQRSPTRHRNRPAAQRTPASSLGR